ncbi:MAG TPA: DUF3862 domain-containing protein [Planctomycetota bacterium]|jgi:hypothetical protein
MNNTQAQPNQAQKAVGGLFGLIVVGAVLYYFFVYGGSDAITKSQFDSVKEGMSYQEVVQIIGSSGTESVSSSMPGVPGVTDTTITKIYSWQNKNGSNAQMTFQNEKLVIKGQFGLK